MDVDYYDFGVVSSILDGMRYPKFANWFNRKLASYPMDQAEFARHYQRVAGLRNSPTGRISEWSTGKARPSDKSCAYIAEVFGVRQRTVLIAADRLEEPTEIPSDGPAARIIELAQALSDKDPAFLEHVVPMLQSRLDSIKQA